MCSLKLTDIFLIKPGIYINNLSIHMDSLLKRLRLCKTMAVLNVYGQLIAEKVDVELQTPRIRRLEMCKKSSCSDLNFLVDECNVLDSFEAAPGTQVHHPALTVKKNLQTIGNGGKILNNYLSKLVFILMPLNLITRSTSNLCGCALFYCSICGISTWLERCWLLSQLL
jgi:hypothetical protein